VTETVDYGIDLGTTNSCIARWEAGAVRVFQNNDQMNVTPSAVHVLRSGRVIVGRRAYAAVLTDPDNVAVEFKRWMGQKGSKRFAAAQRELSAEQLSAEVLKALKEDVRRQSGADVTSAVVTVPAAFGALQCEATARATQAAGLAEAPLLQEPIAAAVGYGARPGSANQRWLVFDLGGGTLDIAVVSTRDGLLNVLEHRGDNLLGGKDIDRVIVEQVLLPALGEAYQLEAAGPASARSALLPRLRVKAEEAKIDLSRDQDVVIPLFDVGVDDGGTPIELDVPLSRSRLEQLIMPLVERCCGLAIDALASARVSGADLDQILLVGGPTQTPLIRSMLRERIGAPVDFSVDPMTVVGRGAAIYASTFERRSRADAAVASSPVSADSVSLKLAYEPVSAELESIIAGRVLRANGEVEIKLEDGSGLWTSGWLKPKEGLFEVTVPLKPGDVTTFWLYARDGQGRLLETDAPEIKVRHGLVPSAPPLPHTLSIEVLGPQGSPQLDPVFAKGTPLPADRKIRYRATHALVPNKPESDLAIKLWEGEFPDDPEANDWVGKVMLSHDAVRRSVPEGAEIDLTIRISASRLISVEGFVPHVNQSFSGQLYVPQRDEQDFSNLSQTAFTEARAYDRRLDELERNARGDVPDPEIERLRREVEELKAKAPPPNHPPDGSDPDDARRFVEKSKSVRLTLGRLERRVADARSSITSPERLHLVERAEKVVKDHGSALEQQELSALTRELGRSTAKGDDRAAQRLCEEIDGLCFRVLSKHDWFWRDILESLSDSADKCVDPAEARHLMAQGRSAVTKGDGPGLREAVRALWKLQQPDSAETASQRGFRTGLRRF
jgi:molecular chaperone DnaK